MGRLPWVGWAYLLEGAVPTLSTVQVVTGHLCKAKTMASGRSSQTTRSHPSSVAKPVSELPKKAGSKKGPRGPSGPEVWGWRGAGRLQG